MAKEQDKQKSNFKKIPLNKLVMADWNYKKFDDPEMHKKLVENIKKNGQIENIIVRKIEDGYEIVNGNHRFLAMKDAGLTEATCYDLGKISLTKAKRIAIETNETKFSSDDKKLAELIGEVIIDEEDFSLTNPFTDDQMKELNALGIDEEDQENKPVTQSPKKTVKSKTARSLAGDKYTTVKVEATPEEADNFTNLIQRFSQDNNTHGSLGIICKFMGKFSDDEVLKAAGVAKGAKKAAKKSLKAASPS